MESAKKKNKLHLICNAHLDPVWLWRWDEGAAEAISTFRVAADFCEEFHGFVFNHNEAVLYQWIEEYEPALFQRIQRLVKEGRWHIMGGWYLQPDCNMPCGEGMIRQIEQGRAYFYEKFGCVPRTAVNVDSFGHSRGLVQILEKTGYNSYLFCRPLREFLGRVIDEWGFDDFTWVGYDGSQVTGHRHYAIYNSKLGKAAQKLEEYMTVRADKDPGLLLWGIGDHGGGPSRQDLQAIEALIGQVEGWEITHSTPEEYFAALAETQASLPRREADLNSWAVGCYTTQAPIKRQYRRLENELLRTEKMEAVCRWEEPDAPLSPHLEQAQTALLFSQFHDILPGTVIPSAMEDSLATMAHGMELLGRERTKAFFRLAQGQPKARDGEIPILAYNPHPYPVEGIFSCEFHMNEEFSRKRFLVVPVVTQDGREIPSQLEQEECQMPMQWRRRAVFRARLAPMAVSRFDCRMEKREIPPPHFLDTPSGVYRFDNGRMQVQVDLRTGLLAHYTVDGVEYIRENGLCPLVIQDDEHSIGTFVRSFPHVAGKFTLMDRAEATEFCGVNTYLLEPVHIVEDGPVRTVLEACLHWNRSQLCLRYFLPKEGAAIEVEAIVHWNEREKMLKLSIPTPFAQGECLGQVMFGWDALPADGRELVAQRWAGVRDVAGQHLLSVINSQTYGLSCENGEMRLSLLRSPRYGCLVRAEDRYILYNRGYVPHTDQGVHSFRFRLEGGAAPARLDALEREAQVFGEEPVLLSFFPCGEGTAPRPPFALSGATSVSVCAVRRLGREMMVRLYNAADHAADAVLAPTGWPQPISLAFGPFQVRTLVLDIPGGSWRETDMLLDRWQTQA